METKTVRVGGTAIAYSDIGEGPPLVLMHGHPDSRRSYERLIEELGGVESGFRIICPDFPGYGDSPEPGPDFDFLHACVSELWEAFFDEVGLDEPAVVVVHDFGGTWLMPWVVDRPERVSGLVILNTAPHPDFRWHFWAKVWQTPVLGELAMALSVRALFRNEMRKGDPALPEGYPDHCFEVTTPATKRTALRTYRAHRDQRSTMAACWEGVEATLTDIPKRVVWGDLDPYIPVDFADIWGCEVTHLPDVGHWVYVSRPDVVAEAIRGLGPAD